jgi:hypothetical protein
MNIDTSSTHHHFASTLSDNFRHGAFFGACIPRNCSSCDNAGAAAQHQPQVDNAMAKVSILNEAIVAGGQCRPP